MPDRDLITVSARVDEDSALAEQFGEYQTQNSMTSKSEAVRHLLRAGLEQELEQDDDVDDSDARDAQPAQAPSDSPQIDIDMIRGNEPVLVGIAFLIGSDGILTATTAVAGGFWGQILFASTGFAIVVAMIPMLIRGLLALARGTSADDDDAHTSGVQS